MDNFDTLVGVVPKQLIGAVSRGVERDYDLQLVRRVIQLKTILDFGPHILALVVHSHQQADARLRVVFVYGPAGETSPQDQQERVAR